VPCRALPASPPTISIQQVHLLLQGAQRRGLDGAALVQAAGMPAVLLSSPLSRVTPGQYARLARLLAHRLRDEFWGLTTRPVPRGSFAQACRLAVASATLGEAIRLVLRHYRLLLDDFVPRLRVADGVAALTVTPRGHVDPPLAYAQRAFAFLAYGVASWLVARRVPLVGVDLAYELDLGQTDAARLFGARVRFGAERPGWQFAAELLAQPVVATAAELPAFLRQAPASLLVKYRDPDRLTERVRAILRRDLAHEPPALTDVANELAMTPQTLRRRLCQQGQGFRALRDGLRRDAAIAWLARPDLTLADIAARLGFSEASTFHRAFKQWTGVAPGEYRQAQALAERVTR